MTSRPRFALRAGANVNWILISQCALGSGAFRDGSIPGRRPANIFFPAYTKDVLAKVRIDLKTSRKP